MIVVLNTASLAALEELIDTGNLLDAVKVHLYQNDTTPTPTMVLADLTEATFTGYAASGVIVWGTPFINDLNQPIVIGDAKQFLSTSPFTVANTVYGYYVTNSAGTVLLWAERFDAPAIVSAAAQGVVVVPAAGLISQAQ